MMKKFFSLYLLLLFLFGCTNRERYGADLLREKKFEKSTELPVFDSIKIEGTFDLIAWTIGINNVSFVSYGVTEGFVSVYSYPVCRKLYDGGRIGQGPGEFVTLNCGSTGNGSLLLYDIMGRKMRKTFVGGDSLSILQTLPLYENQDGYCKPFTDISQIDGSKYLMKVDEVHSSSWEIADLEKREVLGSYVNPIRKSEASYTPFDFMQCVSDSVFLAAYKYMDRIELYSISDDEITPRLIYGTDEDQSGLKDYNDLSCHYISVVSHSGKFYCLKSSDGRREGNIVEVYDLKGNCKEMYILERAVVSLNMDAEGRLVGYVPETDCTVLYRFIL